MYYWISRVLRVFSLCILQLNYLADDSLEILDDPAAVAMMEVFQSISVWYYYNLHCKKKGLTISIEIITNINITN
jgi:hypothetical protein